MISLSWQLAALCLCTAPFMFVFIKLASRKTRISSQHIQDSVDDITRLTNEAFTGFRNIKLYQFGHYIQQKFEKYVNSNRQHEPRLDIVLAFSDGGTVRDHPKAKLIWSDEPQPTDAMRKRFCLAANR